MTSILLIYFTFIIGKHFTYSLQMTHLKALKEFTKLHTNLADDFRIKEPLINLSYRASIAHSNWSHWYSASPLRDSHKIEWPAYLARPPHSLWSPPSCHRPRHCNIGSPPPSPLYNCNNSRWWRAKASFFSPTIKSLDFRLLS